MSNFNGWTTEDIERLQKRGNGYAGTRSVKIQRPLPLAPTAGSVVRHERKFTLPYLTPGLNGKDGLIRQHFHSAGKAKDKIAGDIRSQRPANLRPIADPVRVTYIRYASHLMDWDNACSSFKHIGDALQTAGVLSDDSPQVIVEFVPVQVKCKMKERRTEIIIELLKS